MKTPLNAYLGLSEIAELSHSFCYKLILGILIEVVIGMLTFLLCSCWAGGGGGVVVVKEDIPEPHCKNLSTIGN